MPVTHDDGTAARIDLSEVEFFGPQLSRPECVLATARGDLYCSDARGGIMEIRADGSHTLFLAKDPLESGLVPNGIALLPDNSFLIANVTHTGGLWHLHRDGRLDPILREVDGEQLGYVNFVGLQGDRRWVTVSTRQKPTQEQGASNAMNDGFIILMDHRGARIVADGLKVTNEAKVDPSGKFLYFIETIGRCLSRFDIADDGALSNYRVITEFTRPGALPDGLAFDSEGSVWVTMIVYNGVVRVAPDGTQTWFLEDVDLPYATETEKAFRAGGSFGWTPGENRTLQCPTSIAFGGPDLKTAYLGFLHGDRLARFRVPVTGLEPPHWRF